MMLQELNGPLNGLSLRKDRLYSTSPFPFGCCTSFYKDNKNVLVSYEKYNQYFFQYIISITYIHKNLQVPCIDHSFAYKVTNGKKPFHEKHICTKTFANYRNVAILYSSSHVS